MTEKAEEQSRLEMEGFYIQNGLTETQISQLIEYSRADEEVISQTSDRRRFADREAFDEWLSKGKVIYSLADNNGDLSGIVWFSQKVIEEDETIPFSFAIRLYGAARGRGLARDFAETAINRFFKDTEADGIWLETSLDNAPAVKLYHKLGFEPATDPDELTKRFRMVRYRR